MKHMRIMMLLAVAAVLSITLAACTGGGGGGGQLDPLDRPTNVRMTTNTPTSQWVSWNAVEDAVGYEVWISTGGATATKRNTELVTDTTFNLTGLDLARTPTSHRITIVAVADPLINKDSPMSTSFASLTIQLRPFTTPTIVSNTGLVVTWNSIPEASHYIVTTRRTSLPAPLLTSTVLASADPTRSLDLWSTATTTGRIAAGHSYEVTVVAHRTNPGNTWTQSAASTPAVIDLRGAATLNTPARPTVAGTLLTLSTVTGANEYTVDVIENSTGIVVGTKVVQSGPSPLTLELTDFRLAPAGGNAYSARVKAHGRGLHDSLTFSLERNFTISAVHADAPSALAEDEMLLEWDPSESGKAHTQRIEIWNDVKEEWETKAQNLTSVTDEFNLATLNLAGGEYSVRVVAVYVDGIAPSVPVLFTVVDDTLELPRNPSIDATTGILSWTHVVGATGGYALYVIPVANLGDPLPAPTRTGTAWYVGEGGSPRTFNLNTLTLAPGDYMIQLRSLGDTPLTYSQLTGGIWFVKV